MNNFELLLTNTTPNVLKNVELKCRKPDYLAQIIAAVILA